jgi:hypothetical protein
MTGWRHDLHAHPELGFEEHRASEFVAGKLAEFGCEAHRNIGKARARGSFIRAISMRQRFWHAQQACLPIGNCTIRAGPMMADRTSLPRARLEIRTLPRKGLFDLDAVQFIRNAP